MSAPLDGSTVTSSRSLPRWTAGQPCTRLSRIPGRDPATSPPPWIRRPPGLACTARRGAPALPAGPCPRRLPGCACAACRALSAPPAVPRWRRGQGRLDGQNAIAFTANVEPAASVAMVTGAAHGIGRAIALRLRDDGFRVAAADIEPVGPAAGVTGYPLDVADLDAHEPLLGRIEQELGPLAALVNVAGHSGPQPIDKPNLGPYRRQHAVLMDGPVWLARSAGLRMAARGSGRIVNITSIHSTNGEVASLAYDSAKAGLEAATRTLAIELGPRGVLVNS